MAALAFTQALMFDERSTPLGRKLEFGLSVYAIAGLLLYILPALLLWKVYRGLVTGLCSPLTAVGPDSGYRFQPPARRIAPIVFLVLAGVLFLFLGILAAISSRH